MMKPLNCKPWGALLRHSEYDKAATCGTISVHLPAVILAAVSLSGCLTTTTKIEAEDNNAFLPSLGLNLNLGDGDREASEVRSGKAIEIGYVRTKASSPQALAAGQLPVIHNGTTFTSPQQLNNDFDFSLTDLTWRFRDLLFESSAGMEFSLGVAYSSLDLAVSSPTQRAFERFNNVGAQFGAGLVFRLSPRGSLHARAAGFVTFDYGVSDVGKYEAYYAYALHKNLSLRAGYADYKVNGIGHEGMSGFHLHFAGPTLVLEGDFNLETNSRKPTEPHESEVPAP